MIVVLDTNILIELDAGNESVRLAVEKIKGRFPHGAAIAFATFSEYWYGTLHKPKSFQDETLDWLRSFVLLNSSERSSRMFAELKSMQKRLGRNIPLFDLLIASVVMDNNATLLSTDPHFQEIKGLQFILLKGDRIED